MTRRPTTSISATNAATLRERDAPASSHSSAPRRRCRAVARRAAGERRQQHQHEHHRQVLDDQPADRDAAVDRLEHVAVLERPQQHDRARDREREPEHERRAEASSPSRCASASAERGGDDDLPDRAGDRDRAHRQQVGEREVQPDAEHQQHHADLGELRRRAPTSATKPGVTGPMTMPGEQVADQRRQPQPRRDEAEHAAPARSRRRWWRSG